jgi:hypothetical protein
MNVLASRVKPCKRSKSPRLFGTAFHASRSCDEEAKFWVTSEQVIYFALPTKTF